MLRSWWTGLQSLVLSRLVAAVDADGDRIEIVNLVVTFVGMHMLSQTRCEQFEVRRVAALRNASRPCGINSCLSMSKCIPLVLHDDMAVREAAPALALM